MEICAEILPSKYHNIIVENDIHNIIIRSNLNSIEDILEWVRQFGQNSNTQWNSQKSNPNGKQMLCMKSFVCHHNSFMKVSRALNKKGISKNSGCQARIIVKVKLITAYTIKTDPYIKKDRLCAFIRIWKQHNHSLSSAETLRFLTMSSIRKSFEEYFADGMTASEAKTYHGSLLSENVNVSEVAFASSRKNPTRRNVSYWYEEWRKLNLGPRTGPGLVQKLKEKQAIYTEANVMVVFEEDPFSILIVTPIMKRGHELPMASQLVFVDSTSACDAEHHSVTFILTPCAAGAAPLAILITKGQSTESYTTAFNLLRVNLKNAFTSQGYPNIFMTDNSKAEIDALKLVWPESGNLLCIFHVLQAVWRWLWDSQNKIMNDHRIELMTSFKQMVYSDNFSSLEYYYCACLQCGDKYQYDQWKKYVTNHYWPIKEKWSLVYRSAATRGHHTNNFSESSIPLFKDVVLSRVKAYNVISLIDFSSTVLEKLYVEKFREFANFRKRNSYVFVQKTLKKIQYIQKNDIIELSDSTLYLVPSEENENVMLLLYTVDITIGSCSCLHGKFGKLCKHQCAVYTHFKNIESKHFPAITPNDRYCMAQLALGEQAPDMSFYEEFVAHNTIENFSAQFITFLMIKLKMLILIKAVKTKIHPTSTQILKIFLRIIQMQGILPAKMRKAS